MFPQAMSGNFQIDVRWSVLPGRAVAPVSGGVGLSAAAIMAATKYHE